MIDYVKHNFPVLLIGIAILAVVFFGIKVNSPAPVVNVTTTGGGESESFGANRDSSTITNPFIFQQGITVTGSTATLGTTTAFGSQVPRVLRAAVTVATTSPITAITHQGSPIMCDSNGLNLYAEETGVFNPSVEVSIGLGTNSAANRLIGTTTVATTTSQVVASTTPGVPFRVTNGQTFTVSFADTQASAASSTYFSNITANLSVPCWTIGL